MAQKWLELNKATEELNVELEYLCNLVINGTIKSTTRGEQLFVDVLSLQDTDDVTCIDDDLGAEDEVDSIKIESAWLKSENMRNNLVIKDYHEKFAQLKVIQKELIDIINQQADTIRLLKGYPAAKVKAENAKQEGSANRHNIGISLWMLLPFVGLFLTAGIELVKAYNLYSLKNILSFLGIH